MTNGSLGERALSWELDTEYPGAESMTMKERWDRSEILDEKKNPWSKVGCSCLSRATSESSCHSLTIPEFSA